MPKIVDHADRRRELAHAALRVIGRDGLESATTRAVAEESGWSTGVLKHYFSNKDQLLHEALRELERLNLERFDAATEQPTGLEAIRAAVLTMMQGSHDESRVWIAFMNRATVDGPSGSAMHRAVDAWVKRWQDLVLRGQHDGSIRRELDAGQVALELHALVNGLRFATMFVSRRASTSHRKSLMDLSLLEGLAATESPSHVR